MIQLKRVYDAPAAGDGLRILVDRLWPRGISKRNAHVDVWLKGVAPSSPLRTWFGHDPARWVEFRKRYFAELASRPEEIAQLDALIGAGPVTFVYAARDTEHTHALALKSFVERRAKTRPAKPTRTVRTAPPKAPRKAARRR